MKVAISPSIASKQYGYEDFLADIVTKVNENEQWCAVLSVYACLQPIRGYLLHIHVSQPPTQACLSIVRKESNAPFNVDNVRVCKIPGAGVLSSTVAKGMVFKRSIEGEVTHIEHAKVWAPSFMLLCFYGMKPRY